MALTVEKLNDDTTFLFAFTPKFAPQKQKRRFPGAYTILVDPWLSGSSSILHPTFQISRHTSDCAVKSLADLEEPPDLIIISQDKPDHCHRQTLCQLPSDTHTRILATPAAAKKIWSWKYFDPSIVHVMKPYDPKKPTETMIKIKLAAYTSSSSSGEITIANMPTKRDLTNLHNAICITYRPPGSMLTALTGEQINLSDMMNSPTTPPLRNARSTKSLKETSTSTTTPQLRNARSAKQLKHTDVLTPPTTPRPHTSGTSRPIYLDPLNRTPSLPATTPPDTPIDLQRSDWKHTLGRSRTLSRSRSFQHKEKPLSIMYTPHGVDYSVIKPYVERHLKRTNALPLTALFHSVNVEANPWFMGGVVARGAPGGLPLSQSLSAKHWISAHDEVKDNRGMATTWIKSRQYSVQDVEKMLKKGQGGKGYETEVHLLGVGEVMRIEG